MLNVPNDETITQRDKAIQQFIEDSAFAKIVETSSGVAILIDGQVIEVVSSRSHWHADAIVRALRFSRSVSHTAATTETSL